MIYVDLFTLSYAKNTAYLWRLETVDSAVHEQCTLCTLSVSGSESVGGTLYGVSPGHPRAAVPDADSGEKGYNTLTVP